MWVFLWYGMLFSPTVYIYIYKFSAKRIFGGPPWDWLTAVHTCNEITFGKLNRLAQSEFWFWEIMEARQIHMEKISLKRRHLETRGSGWHWTTLAGLTPPPGRPKASRTPCCTTQCGKARGKSGMWFPAVWGCVRHALWGTAVCWPHDGRGDTGRGGGAQDAEGGGGAQEAWIRASSCKEGGYSCPAC